MLEEPAREDSIETPAVPSRPRGAPFLRDTIEAFVVAVVLALVVKQFAVEAYKVPTGSMEPTIVGDEFSGDRILVNKLVPLIRDPRRWEIWVFQYPNDRRINFIKRVVGIGPESLFIIDGDLYTAPLGSSRESTERLYRDGKLQIARKPRPVQDALFANFPQVRPELLDRPSQIDFQKSWICDPSPIQGASSWIFHDEGVRAQARGDGTYATFRRPIKDRTNCFADLSAENAFGEYVVGDVRLSLSARPIAGGGFVVVEIVDPQQGSRLLARIPIAGESENGALMVEDVKKSDLGDLRLPVDVATDIVFTNVDDQVFLRIDDQRFGPIDNSHPPSYNARGFGHMQKIRFGVEAATVDFNNCGVYRDIYYRDGSLDRFDIPAGNFCFLGDNSAASKDSREWVGVTVITEDGETIYGDSEAILDPDDLQARQDNPYRADVLAGGAGDTRNWFIDQFGRRHQLGAGPRPWQTLVRDHSPLVGRELLMGRAFSVFLPVSRLGIVR
ncbi:MAG: signal peptidase I [Planctomycetes bacterium]|nr:signal peptidase I [Planctomycetota bacterium]